jgi:acetylornithine deacetylase/succinyl-diaminopimelate desuccinylase-like protein
LDGEPVASIKKVVEKFWTGIPIVPSVSRGATDSAYLRGAGIPSYGLNPMPMKEEDAKRAHGIDERIPKVALKTGSAFLHALLMEVAGAK